MKYKVFIEMVVSYGDETFSTIVDASDEDEAEELAIFEMKQEYKNLVSYKVEEVEEINYEFTIDDWEEKYKPLPNPRKDEQDGFDHILFDTHLESDLDVLKGYDPKRIWTLLESDEGMVIVHGFRWVNRMAYLISQLPVEPEDETKEYFAD